MLSALASFASHAHAGIIEGIAMSPSQSRTDYSKLVLANMSSMLAYWDGDLVCRYANPAYLHWFGRPADEILGMRLQELLGAETFALNEVYVRGALAGMPQLFERTLRCADGERRHSLARYHPVQVDGRQAGFIAEVTDVTALKQLELSLQAEVAMHGRTVTALQRQDAAMQTVQQLGKIGSWEWERGADITTWSQELYHLFGYDAGKLPPGMNGQADLYLPSSWCQLRVAVDCALEHGHPYVMRLEYWGARREVGWLEVRGEVERDGAGAIIGLRGTAQDVTVSHKLVEAVLAQTQRLKLALTAAQLGLWQWDNAKRVLVCENDRARAIFGIDVSSTTVHASDFITELLHADDLDRFCSALAECETGGTAFFFQGRIIRHGDQQVRWVEWYGRFDHFSRDAGIMIGTVADITEWIGDRHAMRDALFELEASSLRKTRFLSALGHEMRNCLAPLALGLKALRLQAHDEVAQKIGGMMDRQLMHLGHLVDDIYDLRRIENGTLTLDRSLIALESVAESAIEMAGPALDKGAHRFLLVAPAQPLLVHGDPVRLTQALLNLLVNAAKFTPPGGVITMTLGVAANGDASVSVTDNGIGLLPAELDSIFGLYVQGDDAVAGGGLGIGLHLVRRFVELHGGAVTATSAGRGKGSTFTIILPRSV